MNELIALITIFWTPVLIVLIKKYLWDLYFWQIKEYRWDRFWSHILWDQDEHNRNYYVLGIKFILFATITLIFEIPLLALFGIILAYIIWVFESFEFAGDILSQRILRPSLKSIRNILILVFLIVISVLIVVYITAPFLEFSKNRDIITGSSELIDYVTDFTVSNNFRQYPDVFILIAFLTLVGLLLDLGAPLIVPSGVLLTTPLAYFRRKMIISRAKEKYDRLKHNLTLVAITGSQGKTTTKEILYEMLRDKFNVAKTPENYNTAVGIAHAVLNNINEKTQVFIAEMGAYKKGEIQEACENFTPDISVITDIDTQHVGLFGSRDKLAHAKGEIIRYMKDQGIAILNGDNHYCRLMAKDLKNFVVLISSDHNSDAELKHLEDPKTKLYKAKDIYDHNDILTFEFFDSKEKTFIGVKGVHKHLVNSILICIAVCKELGMTTTEIAEKLAIMKFKLPRLTVDTGDNETLILNDSYNSSLKGFVAAVELMNKTKDDKNKNKRIVITKGIYELGKEKSTIYKELLHKIRDKVDVLITSDSLLANIAMMDNTSIEIIKAKTSNDMIYSFREKTNKGDIILLEGRLNPKIIQAIVSDKL